MEGNSLLCSNAEMAETASDNHFAFHSSGSGRSRRYWGARGGRGRRRCYSSKRWTVKRNPICISPDTALCLPPYAVKQVQKPTQTRRQMLAGEFRKWSKVTLHPNLSTDLLVYFLLLKRDLTWQPVLLGLYNFFLNTHCDVHFFSPEVFYDLSGSRFEMSHCLTHYGTLPAMPP